MYIVYNVDVFILRAVCGGMFAHARKCTEHSWRPQTRWVRSCGAHRKGLSWEMMKMKSDFELEGVTGGKR